jgi:hypothetical protein
VDCVIRHNRGQIVGARRVIDSDSRRTKRFLLGRANRSIETIPREALVVKALALLQLFVGFVGGVLVARLAIARLGLGGFGDFAFVLGFAALFALSDLGIVPGLTAEIGDRLRAGKRAAAQGLVALSCVVAAGTWIVLAAASLAFVRFASPAAASGLLVPLGVFAMSAALVSVADVGATLLKVDGELVFAYVARLLYQLLWIGGVGIAFAAIPEWPDIAILTLVQLGASVAYAITIAVRIVRRRRAPRAAPKILFASIRSAAWRRAWRISTPERSLRVLGAVLALGERSLLMAMGGAAVLGSYDLLLRVSALISAIPSALAQPLLSMLAANRATVVGAAPFGDIARFTMRVTWLLTLAGLGAAVVLWIYFAEMLFGVHPELPWALAMCVFAATAINVQTAVGVAISTSEGVVDRVNRKVVLEIAGIAVAAIVGLLAGNVLWFIGVRYLALGIAATLFLVQFRRRRTAMSGLSGLREYRS